MTCIFRHKFDPEKWKEISSRSAAQTIYHLGRIVGVPLSLGNERVFSNTCTKCGDLVFRRVVEIEP